MLVDAARARAEVPRRFAITGAATGKAVLFIAFTSCDLSLNGGAPQRTTFSDAGILINPPGGSVGLNLYRPWDVTSSGAMALLDQAYGIATGSPPGLAVSFEPGVLESFGTASVPWSQGAYGLRATYEAVVPPAVPGTTTWWTLGPEGLARFDQKFKSPDREIQGIGHVTADPTGRAGALIGARATAEMQLSFADLLGTARVVGP